MIANIRITVPSDDLAEICRSYQVRELAIFSSVLSDDFSNDSDIDVLVDFEHEAQVTFFHLAQLQRALEEPFGRKIDVVMKRGLNPIIRRSVLKSARVLYATSRCFTGSD